MLLPWIFISLAFLIAELGHPGAYFFLSFSIGSFVSFLYSIWCVDTIIQQIILFFVSSVLGFILLHTFVKIAQPKETKTGVDALIGRKIDSIKQIQDNLFEVKISGQIWNAKFEHNQVVDISEIIVKQVKGTHLILGKGN